MKKFLKLFNKNKKTEENSHLQEKIIPISYGKLTIILNSISGSIKIKNFETELIQKKNLSNDMVN